MTKTQSLDFFTNNISTLKETSKDDSDGAAIYMTASTLRVVNFDKVKEEYIKNLNISETPASNDALFKAEDGSLVFIEFKNGHIDKPTCYGIKRKIFESLLIFTDITQVGISYTRKNMDYILVYNEKKNQDSQSKDKITHALMDLACEKTIRFDLKRFKNYCFKNVYTYTEQEFEEEFIKKYN